MLQLLLKLLPMLFLVLSLLICVAECYFCYSHRCWHRCCHIFCCYLLSLSFSLLSIQSLSPSPVHFNQLIQLHTIFLQYIISRCLFLATNDEYWNASLVVQIYLVLQMHSVLYSMPEPPDRTDKKEKTESSHSRRGSILHFLHPQVNSPLKRRPQQCRATSCSSAQWKMYLWL